MKFKQVLEDITNGAQPGSKEDLVSQLDTLTTQEMTDLQNSINTIKQKYSTQQQQLTNKITTLSKQQAQQPQQNQPQQQVQGQQQQVQNQQQGQTQQAQGQQPQQQPLPAGAIQSQAKTPLLNTAKKPITSNGSPA